MTTGQALQSLSSTVDSPDSLEPRRSPGFGGPRRQRELRVRPRRYDDARDGEAENGSHQNQRGGAPDTNRTCDPPLRRGMLYPLSYGGLKTLALS